MEDGVNALLKLATLEDFPRDTLVWTRETENRGCIDGLLTALVTYAGIVPADILRVTPLEELGIKSSITNTV